MAVQSQGVYRKNSDGSWTDYNINNQSQVINNNNSIGDIVIQNPVGNSDDLAREFASKLTLSLQRPMYTNLKK